MTDIPFLGDKHGRSGQDTIQQEAQTSASSVIKILVKRATPAETAPRTDSRDLLRYWNATRKDLDLPRRADIDPRGIAGMLSRTFILEQIAPGLARFRVAGTQLAELLGMDVRGMPLSAMVLPDARDELAHNLQKVFEMPGILRATLVSPGAFRRPELEAELLILPLRDERGDVTRAIGCLVSHGAVGKTPRRFSFRHMRVDPVSVVRTTQDPISSIKPSAQARATRTHSAPARPGQTGSVTALKGPRLAPLKPGQPTYLRLVLPD